MIPNPVNDDGNELIIWGREDEYAMIKPIGNMKKRIPVVNGTNHLDFFGYSS
jgi:hypothetical protein